MVQHTEGRRSGPNAKHGSKRQSRETPCGVYSLADLHSGVIKPYDREKALAVYRRRIVERFRVEFRDLAAAECNDRALGDLALEQSFDEAFQSLSLCKSPESFRKWFIEILKQQCRALTKRRSTQPLRIQNLSERHP